MQVAIGEDAVQRAELLGDDHGGSLCIKNGDWYGYQSPYFTTV
jgi:hypothetical protein